jgi:hypothetical protein
MAKELSRESLEKVFVRLNLNEDFLVMKNRELQEVLRGKYLKLKNKKITLKNISLEVSGEI